MCAHDESGAKHLVQTVGAKNCNPGKRCARGLHLPSNANTQCEHDSLRARLPQVRHPCHSPQRFTLDTQIERENMELYSEIQQHEAAQGRAEARFAEIFAFFDEVNPPCCALFSDRLMPRGQIYTKWQELPLEDLQTWTLLTAKIQRTPR